MKTFNQFYEDRAFYDQTYSDDKGEWLVPDIERYAKKYGTRKKVSIKELERHLEPTEYENTDERPDSPEFAKRARRADLTYPILLIDYGPGDGLWVADGVHRIFLAKELGLKTINVVIISKEELYTIDHENI